MGGEVAKKAGATKMGTQKKTVENAKEKKADEEEDSKFELKDIDVDDDGEVEIDAFMKVLCKQVNGLVKKGGSLNFGKKPPQQVTQAQAKEEDKRVTEALKLLKEFRDALEKSKEAVEEEKKKGQHAKDEAAAKGEVAKKAGAT